MSAPARSVLPVAARLLATPLTAQRRGTIVPAGTLVRRGIPALP